MVARAAKYGTSAAAIAWAFLVAFGCKSGDAPIAPTNEDALVAAPSAPPAPIPHLAFVDAPAEGDVASIVRDELVRARKQGVPLIVYVGAAWCEPCRRFHEAAAQGALDAELPPVRFLVFDLDRDKDRLVADGYATEWIPLFVAPDDDGRGTAHRIAGSIKGPGAPMEIAPRLREILPH